MTLRHVNLQSFISQANQRFNLSIISANSMETLGSLEAYPVALQHNLSGLSKGLDVSVDDLCVSDDGERALEQQIFEKEARVRLEEQGKLLERLESVVQELSGEIRQSSKSQPSEEIKPVFSKSNLFSSIENAKVQELKDKRRALLVWVNEKADKRFGTLDEAVAWRISELQK